MIGSEVSTVGLNAQALKNLDASIQKDIDDGRNFGASIIVARNGNIGHKATFGTVAPGRKPADDDLYLLMSLTKAYTATLVLRSIDKGLFTLDTRIDDLLPGYGAAGKQRTTVRMLLNHTGGAFPAFVPPGLTVADIGNLEKFVQVVSALPATFKPGTRCSYTPVAGPAILARAVVVTDPQKRSFTQIVNEDLFKPLGMNDSSLGLDQKNHRKVPVSVTESQMHPGVPAMMQLLTTPCDEGMELAGGGAYGTAMDVFRFVETLRKGGTSNGYRLLSRSLLDYALRNHTGDMINGAWEFECERKDIPLLPANFSLMGGYVRGEGHFRTGMGYTASPKAFCAIGGASTMFMVDPERDLTFIFLSAGFIEGLDHFERLCRLSDLALAACE